MAQTLQITPIMCSIKVWLFLLLLLPFEKAYTHVTIPPQEKSHAEVLTAEAWRRIYDELGINYLGSRLEYHSGELLMSFFRRTRENSKKQLEFKFLSGQNPIFYHDGDQAEPRTAVTNVPGYNNIIFFNLDKLNQSNFNLSFILQILIHEFGRQFSHEIINDTLWSGPKNEEDFIKKIVDPLAADMYEFFSERESNVELQLANGEKARLQYFSSQSSNTTSHPPQTPYPWLALHLGDKIYDLTNTIFDEFTNRVNYLLRGQSVHQIAIQYIDIEPSSQKDLYYLRADISYSTTSEGIQSYSGRYYESLHIPFKITNHHEVIAYTDQLKNFETYQMTNGGKLSVDIDEMALRRGELKLTGHFDFLGYDISPPKSSIDVQHPYLVFELNGERHEVELIFYKPNKDKLTTYHVLSQNQYLITGGYDYIETRWEKSPVFTPSEHPSQHSYYFTHSMKLSSLQTSDYQLKILGLHMGFPHSGPLPNTPNKRQRYRATDGSKRYFTPVKRVRMNSLTPHSHSNLGKGLYLKSLRVLQQEADRPTKSLVYGIHDSHLILFVAGHWQFNSLAFKVNITKVKNEVNNREIVSYPPSYTDKFFDFDASDIEFKTYKSGTLIFVPINFRVNASKQQLIENMMSYRSTVFEIQIKEIYAEVASLSDPKPLQYRESFPFGPKIYYHPLDGLTHEEFEHGQELYFSRIRSSIVGFEDFFSDNKILCKDIF